MLLKIKTHFRAKLLSSGPATPSRVGGQTPVSLSETHVQGDAPGGPSVPSPHVLCKAGPMREGLPSASVHTARGWGTHPWGLKICDRDEGGRTEGAPRSTRVRRSWVLLAAGLDHSSSSPPIWHVVRCGGAGSAWSPKGHGSQPGFTAESTRNPEKMLAPGSTRTAGSLGRGPGHHTCCQPLPWATPGPAPLLWGPGCTWGAD